MNRIVVATDISGNSGAALRFALQLASQRPVSLTFLNVHNVLTPTTWHKSQRLAHIQRELADTQQRLEQFVEETQQQVGVTIAEHACVVINSPSVDQAIMAYAQEHQFDYICIGERGAGTIQKLIGTTAATLINESTIPVIAVPAPYTASLIKDVLYASDLTSLEPEINQVVAIAQPLNAAIHLVHVTGNIRQVVDCAIIETTIRRFTDYPVHLHLDEAIKGHTLAANLEQIIQQWRPSLLIMFTTRRSGFMERLFSPSHSAEYAFVGSIPLLVFNKH